MPKPSHWDISRRDLMIAGATTAATLTMASSNRGQASVAAQAGGRGATATEVGFSVNGQARRLTADNRLTLLDALRESLKLTGSKKGCDHGQCGACTVIVNGRRINSCLSLAVMHEGDEITTVEGLGTPEAPGPMQAAFIERDGYQCGYCTPGQICSAMATLDEIRAGIPSHVSPDLNGPMEASADEIRERMSGNNRRCGAYSNILAAIQDVSESQA